MRTCATCPGGANCAGENLAPVLAEVHALYTAGSRDKFAILFALSAQSEALFERYNDQVSRTCWTKAALETIADALAAFAEANGGGEAFDDSVRDILRAMVGAFANFPWYVSGLVGQAPDLYETVRHLEKGDIFASRISKRNFVKICKEVVYNEQTG